MTIVSPFFTLSSISCLDMRVASFAMTLSVAHISSWLKGMVVGGSVWRMGGTLGLFKRVLSRSQAPMYVCMCLYIYVTVTVECLCLCIGYIYIITLCRKKNKNIYMRNRKQWSTPLFPVPNPVPYLISIKVKVHHPAEYTQTHRPAEYTRRRHTHTHTHNHRHTQPCQSSQSIRPFWAMETHSSAQLWCMSQMATQLRIESPIGWCRSCHVCMSCDCDTPFTLHFTLHPDTHWIPSQSIQLHSSTIHPITCWSHMQFTHPTSC